MKLGVKAPDIYYSPKKCSEAYGGDWSFLGCFHALGSFNYVKVYEDIMNMALECKKNGIGSAQSIAYPNGYAGDYNECATVRAYLKKANISLILEEQGNLDYTKKRGALILMGFAMHVMGDTYAHKGAMNDGHNNWIWSEEADDEHSVRFKYAKKACSKVLAIWNGNCRPSFEEYDNPGHTNLFRLQHLYQFSECSDNGINFNFYSNNIRKLSFGDY